jgi:hypothetical protein
MTAEANRYKAHAEALVTAMLTDVDNVAILEMARDDEYDHALLAVAAAAVAAKVIRTWAKMASEDHGHTVDPAGLWRTCLEGQAFEAVRGGD